MHRFFDLFYDLEKMLCERFWESHFINNCLLSVSWSVCVNIENSGMMTWWITLYSRNVHGKLHLVVSIRSSRNMNIILSYSLPKCASIDQLEHTGILSTVNLLQGGWHPARVMMLLSTQDAKLYSLFGSQGLSGRLSFSCFTT